MAVKKKSVMGGIKEYIETCPAIKTYTEALGKEVGVNFLDEPEKSYSIEQEPNEPWEKKYVDGTGVKVVTVTFASREAYGKDTLDNLATCGFYDELEAWIEENNRNKVFPVLGDKKIVREMKVSSTPYVFDTSRTKAKYQLTIQIRYWQEV